MINFINSWAQGIILAVIIATIIEMILPEGKNKKYVKTIIGIYIIFVIVFPLTSKIINKNINIEELFDNVISKTDENIENSELTINTNAYIEETYKEKIKDDINKRARDKNYEINFLELNIETSEENFGQINNISMQISKVKNKENTSNITNNDINKIETVEINIFNNSIKEPTQKENTGLSEKEINEFKEYLSTSYGTQKENIQIN